MKTLEQKVMARVHRIYYLRKATGPTALKLYGLCGIMAGLLSVVSVANVFANMPSPLSPVHLVAFFTSAFKNTELMVQLLVAGLCTIIALFVYDIVRTARTHHRQDLYFQG
jgi:hypothetical protein